MPDWTAKDKAAEQAEEMAPLELSDSNPYIAEDIPWPDTWQKAWGWIKRKVTRGTTLPRL